MPPRSKINTVGKQQRCSPFNNEKENNIMQGRGMMTTIIDALGPKGQYHYHDLHYSTTKANDNDNNNRRKLFKNTIASAAGAVLLSSSTIINPKRAEAAAASAPTLSADEIEKLNDEAMSSAQDTETATKPDIPAAPEERSGLVVLRVAEVAQFQEKILRAVVNGDLPPDVKVAPMQFSFGTTILLKNSNLDGNIKLMIREEIPRPKRDLAIKNAVVTMNTLEKIRQYAASIERDFENSEMIELADMYRSVRLNLNQLYEYLPEKQKKKYDGYFMAVTEYEKKIADGTYNPDIDGVLKFD